MADSMTSNSLMDHYELTEEECSKEVSDFHLDQFCNSRCRDWRLLPSNLAMESIVVQDIDRNQATPEKEKRRNFFKEWKLKKGFDATYKALIGALLEIKCREDAEYVCKMLKTASTPSPPAQKQESSTVSNGSGSQSDAKHLDIDAAVERRLDLYLKQIQTHYALYVSHICDSLKKKRKTVSDLLTYLLNLPAFKYHKDEEQHKLLRGKREKLKKEKTINGIFDLIGEECASFLNYDIFESIAQKYGVVESSDTTSYPEHLKFYLNKHTVSEFVKVNKALEKKCDSSKRDFTFKFDIKLTERVAGIFDLKKCIADILDLEYLELIDIKEGCVMVTFLVPAHVADVIGQVFTPKQVEKFRALRVIWLESGGKRLLDFGSGSDVDPTTISEVGPTQNTEPVTAMSATDSVVSQPVRSDSEPHDVSEALATAVQPRIIITELNHSGGISQHGFENVSSTQSLASDSTFSGRNRKGKSPIPDVSEATFLEEEAAEPIDVPRSRTDDVDLLRASSSEPGSETDPEYVHMLPIEYDSETFQNSLKSKLHHIHESGAGYGDSSAGNASSRNSCHSSDSFISSRSDSQSSGYSGSLASSRSGSHSSLTASSRSGSQSSGYSDTLHSSGSGSHDSGYSKNPGSLSRRAGCHSSSPGSSSASSRGSSWISDSIHKLIEAIPTPKYSDVEKLCQKGRQIGIISPEEEAQLHSPRFSLQLPAKYLYLLSKAQQRLWECNSLSLLESWFRVLSDRGVATDVLDELRQPFYQEISQHSEPIDIESLSIGLKHTDCTSLTLAKCGIDNKGCKILADGLACCKNLTKIELNENEIGSEGAIALAGALKHCSLLETVNMAVNQIDDTCIIAFAHSIQHCTQLRALNLSFNHISDSGATVLAKGLTNFTNLRKVDLKHNRIGDEGAIAITTAIKHMKNLKLQVHSHKITDYGANTILSLKDDTERSFHVLTLNSSAEARVVAINMMADKDPHNNTRALDIMTSDNCAEHLVTILRHSTNLRTLNLGNCSRATEVLTDGLQHCTHLHTLNLEGNHIGSSGAKKLADGLKHWKDLHTLNLEWNHVGSEGAKALADGLPRCSNLHTLNFERNQIGSDGLRALADSLRHCSNLHMLNLKWNGIGSDGARALANSLQHCSNLHTLNFEGNHIGSDGACALAEGLRHCRNLHTLNLEGNHIASYGMSKLADSLQHCSNLCILNLVRNGIGNDGARALADGLRHCSNLRTLNLKGNDIRSNGTRALVTGIQHCSNLHTLILEWNRIGNDGARALADGLQHCSNLQTLNLEENDIGSDGARALANTLWQCNDIRIYSTSYGIPSDFPALSEIS